MTIKTRTTLITLAFAMTAFANWGSAPSRAHAATMAAPVTGHTFALPGALVGPTLRLKSTKHYGDGSTTYIFSSVSLPDHPDAFTDYLVNTGNSSTAAASAYSAGMRGGMGKSFFGGTVTPYREGIAWGYTEEGDAGVRITMGGYYRRTAFVVSVITTNTDDKAWAINETAVCVKALIQRLP